MKKNLNISYVFLKNRGDKTPILIDYFSSKTKKTSPSYKSS